MIDMESIWDELDAEGRALTSDIAACEYLGDQEKLDELLRAKDEINRKKGRQ